MKREGGCSYRSFLCYGGGGMVMVNGVLCIKHMRQFMDCGQRQRIFSLLNVNVQRQG
jgi:hypothetical protein